MSNPYSYTPTEDGQGYEFTTHSSVTYIFYFRLASEHLDDRLPFYDDIYDFSFEPIGNKPDKKDIRVQDTIIHAIQALLSDKSKVLLYICDSLDEKQFFRKRLFDNWVKKHDDGDIVKIDFEVEESMAIGSLLLRKSNPNLELIRAFLENKIQEYKLLKS